jgi:hypothetical protein
MPPLTHANVKKFDVNLVIIWVNGIYIVSHVANRIVVEGV